MSETHEKDLESEVRLLSEKVQDLQEEGKTFTWGDDVREDGRDTARVSVI